MDAYTRGVISQTINNVFETQNVLETVEWILESDNQVKSREDLALGYFLGALSTKSHNLVHSMRCEEKKKRNAELSSVRKIGKERTRAAIETIQQQQKEKMAKGGRPLKIEVTEKETDEIRSMLVPMIMLFRDKIRKEEALRKVKKS